MDKKVFKYLIKADDVFEIDLPVDAQLLTVQFQHNDAFMWCLVDPHQDVFETRKFRLAGTGHLIQEEVIQYVGTFQMAGGNLVFHLFEIK